VKRSSRGYFKIFHKICEGPLRSSAASKFWPPGVPLWPLAAGANCGWRPLMRQCSQGIEAPPPTANAPVASAESARGHPATIVDGVNKQIYGRGWQDS
jgi:hypothetical protein